jgi:hypothetical protein
MSIYYLQKQLTLITSPIIATCLVPYKPLSATKISYLTCFKSCVLLCDYVTEGPKHEALVIHIIRGLLFLTVI